MKLRRLAFSCATALVANSLIAGAEPASAYMGDPPQSQPHREDPKSKVTSVQWQKSMDEATNRADEARHLWKQGHRREALTAMLLAHRELNAINSPKGQPDKAFDMLSGLSLAAMYDELGEPVEAYHLYRRAIRRPVATESESFMLRADVLLSFSEVCKKLGKDVEAKWAFDQIAKGDLFETYRLAAEDSLSFSRFDHAERWTRKALELRPTHEALGETLRVILDIKQRGLQSEIG